jgi:arsenate reductase
MDIYGLKTCDTCRKAQKALPDARFRDLRADPLSAEELSDLWQALGEGMLNRASTTWRGLSDEDRKKDALTLMAAHPALIKRPIFAQDDRFYLGWSAQTQAALGISR